MVRPPKTSYSQILGVHFPQGTMYWWLFVLMILTCLISTHQPLCDEVKLSSGDVLKGTIVEHNEVPLGDFRVDLRRIIYSAILMYVMVLRTILIKILTANIVLHIKQKGIYLFY